MKFKKIAAAVMAGTLAVFTMTGCSEQVNNYCKETEKMNSWEGIDTTATGTIGMNVMGQAAEIKFNADGYVNGKDKKGYVNLKFDGDLQGIKLPNMDMYIDKSTAYISKSYFTDTYKNSGIPVPKGIETIPAQYIGLESEIDVEKLSSGNTIETLEALKKQFLGDAKIDIPMTQNDREYTINLNDEQIADISEKILSGVISNMSNLNLGLNEEALKEAEKAANSDEFKNGIKDFKDSIKGSAITVKEKFADDSYISNINIDLKIKNIGTVTVNVDSKSTKAAAKEVEMPLGRVKLTQKQYIEAVMGDAAKEAFNEEVAADKAETAK